MNKRQTVVVTGFGPFGRHAVNASWESVKVLKTLNLEDEFEINLVTYEIPVDYEYVQENIPKLWNTHKPVLVVHVGVSSLASVVTLEQRANNQGYVLGDVNNSLPSGGLCCNSNQDCQQICAGLDIQQVANRINEAGNDVVACISNDAGRYLCEFTYFRSLSMDACKCAFIHVPELNKPYTSKQLGSAIKIAIGALLEQVRKKPSKPLQNGIISTEILQESNVV